MAGTPLQSFAEALMPDVRRCGLWEAMGSVRRRASVPFARGDSSLLSLLPPGEVRAEGSRLRARNEALTQDPNQHMTLSFPNSGLGGSDFPLRKPLGSGALSQQPKVIHMGCEGRTTAAASLGKGQSGSWGVTLPLKKKIPNLDLPSRLRSNKPD